jgi:hypothetical protein
MPFAVTPKPQTPDVPHASGVPAVFRTPTKAVFTTGLLVADVFTVLNAFGPLQWGIFSEAGFPILIPDSIVAVDVRREWRISDYPVERGGFQSFDKVQLPGDIRVRMAVGGAVGLLSNAFFPKTGRRPFLDQLDAIVASLNLYTVVTPDVTYPSFNITHYDYRREQRSGASLLLVDLWLQEVRVTAQTQFTNTKSPEGAANVAGGNVQGKTPTPSQVSAASSIPTSGGL